jgi:hypothetical protein
MQVRGYRLESVNDPVYRTRQCILREVNPASHKSPQGEEKLATENGAPGDVATWSARERSVVNLNRRALVFGGHAVLPDKSSRIKVCIERNSYDLAAVVDVSPGRTASRDPSAWPNRNVHRHREELSKTGANFVPSRMKWKDSLN